MFGFKFIKFQPTDYVLRYKNGKIIKEGLGLSFYYYAPTNSLVSVPMGSFEAPFIFEELTTDYQVITIQGQVTYKITDAKKIAQLLNYTLDYKGKNYISDDPKKLSPRIVNIIQVLAKKELQNLSLRDALKSTDSLVLTISKELKNNGEILSLGLNILGLSILAIRPNKETARALEAEAREEILKEADDAIYTRRNASVEQERKIKENELNTEIAIENKKRQIRETQMDTERSVLEKKHELQKSEMEFSIKQEEAKKKFINLKVQNSKEEADANAYNISSIMKSLQGVDINIIEALISIGMKPQQIIANAFQGLAENASKIGQLNVSSELLQELLKKDE